MFAAVEFIRRALCVHSRGSIDMREEEELFTRYFDRLYIPLVNADRELPRDYEDQVSKQQNRINKSLKLDVFQFSPKTARVISLFKSGTTTSLSIC